ncbi:MAG TPA: dihydrofolate reductase family protein [Flavisolibacter sp.]
MRKLVAGFACSLDGYIEGLKGEYDWIVIDKEVNFVEQMKRYDTYLYGRKTYEAVVRMGGVDTASRHYVFSKTLADVKKGFTLVRDDVKDLVSRLKQEPGKDIALFGGASLLASLLNLDLVDEISISVIPVLLGAGRPMVEVLNRRVWLDLVSTKTYRNGTLALTYNVKMQSN